MSVGDLVVFLPDPLHYGVGEIVEVLALNALLVEFRPPDRDPTREPCHPHEIELLARWQAHAGEIGWTTTTDPDGW